MKTLSKSLLLFLLLGFIISPTLGLTQESKLSFSPDCKPWVIPGSGSGACDFPVFVSFLNDIIKWLAAIAIPVAALFLAWGGFKILSSAGNTSQLETGKNVIRATIVGIIILLLAFIIVQLVFKTLGSEVVPEQLPTSGQT